MTTMCPSMGHVELCIFYMSPTGSGSSTGGGEELRMPG